MIKNIIVSIKFLLMMTVITGIIYPLLVTGITWIAFSKNAKGDLSLTGQSFTSDKYLWGRPEGVTNFSLNNSKLKGEIQTNAKRFNMQINEISPELLMSSGSGLDPHISIQGALIQVERIANARKISKNLIQNLINIHTEAPDLGFLGQIRVNVLKFNLALDELTKN